MGVRQQYIALLFRAIYMLLMMQIYLNVISVVKFGQIMFDEFNPMPLLTLTFSFHDDQRWKLKGHGFKLFSFYLVDLFNAKFFRIILKACINSNLGY